LTTATLQPSSAGVEFRQPSVAVPQQTPGSRIINPTPSVAASPQVPLPQTAQVFVQPSPVQQPAVEVAQPMSPGQAPVARAKSDEWGFTINPMMVIILIMIFVVVFIILFVTKSNMVTDLVNGDRVLNNSKLVFWTVVISIVLSIVALIVSAAIRRRSPGRV